MKKRGLLVKPVNVQSILAAWETGDEDKAIWLTILYRQQQQRRRCLGRCKDGTQCDRILAEQAKGDYCTGHRHQDPIRKKVVAKAVKQSKRDSKQKHE